MQPNLIACGGKLQLGTATARVVIRPEREHVIDMPGGRETLGIEQIYAEAFRRLVTYECSSYALEERTAGDIVCYLQRMPDERVRNVRTSVVMDTAVY